MIFGRWRWSWSTGEKSDVWQVERNVIKTSLQVHLRVGVGVRERLFETNPPVVSLSRIEANGQRIYVLSLTIRTLTTTSP